MLENTFLEDWDEIGTKMAKKGHLLPKSGINSELVSIQRVIPSTCQNGYGFQPRKIVDQKSTGLGISQWIGSTAKSWQGNKPG